MSLPSEREKEFLRLEVKRCAYEESFVLRVLSPHYGGLLTHVVRKHGEYCPMPKEACQHHKLPLQWKGYAAVQVWDAERELWIPWTFELSESFELDVRGKWARGQLWNVSRGPLNGHKGVPIVGRKVGEVDPDSLPAEFDYRPPVHSIYHRFTVDLTTRNPMPDRVILSPSEGMPPPGHAPQMQGLSDWDIAQAKIAESSRRWLERKSQKNGHK